MGKKIFFSLMALLLVGVFSTSVLAAAPDGKGKPEVTGKPEGKGPSADGVVTKPNGDVINTGKSDQDPGPSPT